MSTTTARPRDGQPPRAQEGEKKIVLVVEDEEDISALVRFHLEQEGFAVVVAPDGEHALELARRQRPALVILDLMLPGTPGLEVCRLMRGDERLADVPIVMLTARAGEADRVVGLEMGADDYVTKPFSPRELAARVRAVMRRGHPEEAGPPPIYRGEHLVADFDAVSIAVDGASIRLTRREFELLKYLVENRNRVLSRDRLLERVWGYDRMIETRSVDVHVGRLRGKLGAAGKQIETVIGMGYRFSDFGEN